MRHRCRSQGPTYAADRHEHRTWTLPGLLHAKDRHVGGYVRERFDRRGWIDPDVRAGAGSPSEVSLQDCRTLRDWDLHQAHRGAGTVAEGGLAARRSDVADPWRQLPEHRDRVAFVVVLAQNDRDRPDLSTPSTDRLQSHDVRRRESAVSESDPETAEQAPTPIGAAVGVEEAVAATVCVRAVVEGVGNDCRSKGEYRGASKSHTKDCPTHSSLPSLRVGHRDESNELEPLAPLASKPGQGDASDSHHHPIVSERRGPEGLTEAEPHLAS